MPRLTNKAPKYGRKKRKVGKDRAQCYINGKQVDLGVYGSDAGWQKYHRLVGEWQSHVGLSRAGPASGAKQGQLEDAEQDSEGGGFPLGTMGFLLNRFADAIDKRLTKVDRKTGLAKPNREAQQVRQICEVAIASEWFRYGMIQMPDVYATQMERFRQDLCECIHVARNGRESRWNRTHVTEMLNKLSRGFRWGAARKLAPAEIETMTKLLPLRVGENGVLEPKERDEVSDDVVALTLPIVTPTIADMIMVLRLTGMRADEMCQLEWPDIDESKDIWWYRPTDHKKKHLGKVREVAIGPRCQEILENYRTKKGYLFSPRDSEEERRKTVAMNRKTPVKPSNCRGARRKANPEVAPGDVFTPDSFRQSVQKRCRRNQVPLWFPHQLRAKAGSEAEELDDKLEAAAARLGHESTRVTRKHYAKRNRQLAEDVARRIG